MPVYATPADKVRAERRCTCTVPSHDRGDTINGWTCREPSPVPTPPTYAPDADHKVPFLDWGYARDVADAFRVWPQGFVRDFPVARICGTTTDCHLATITGSLSLLSSERERFLMVTRQRENRGEVWTERYLFALSDITDIWLEEAK